MLSHNILNQIVLYKKNWIYNQEKVTPLHTLKSQIQVSTRNFYKTVFNHNNQTIFILEYKRTSPSTKVIHCNLNPIEIANIYKHYASVISVVTDEKYFQGTFTTLLKISQSVTQPILCKDFFITEWQIYFARAYKADAILLILSILDDDTYRKLVHIAHSLNMGILTEISNKHELQRAINLDAKVIGINNRNLHDFSIDLNRTINLSKGIPSSIVTISESGITNYHHIRKLRHYVNGFLIGTILMSQNQLNTAINRLILGENKICGITRYEDANFAHKLGSIYLGLIFVKNSPRCINIVTAEHIVSSSIKNLNYVGVFCNAKINNIVNIAKILNLYAVQLHGIENQDYINMLRVKLPITCRIWKSVNMNQKKIPTCNLLHINRYLLDNGGGSGKTFNWAHLSKMQLNKIILAGGLTISNCAEATTLGCAGLDFNSGVESSPGIKNHQKLIKIFQILRTY